MPKWEEAVAVLVHMGSMTAGVPEEEITTAATQCVAVKLTVWRG
jgi:hypothetical protein